MAWIRAVLFDYGLVLSGPPDPGAWGRMRALLAAEEPSFYAAYWRPRLAYDQGVFDGPGFWRAVAEELGRRLDAGELQGLLEADVDLWTQPNRPMIAWAGALQRAGVRTGVLSNMGDAMEEGVLRRCPWMAGFDCFTFSHRARKVKPEAAIYQDALACLQVHAQQVLFVDDREENVEAARAAGMHALEYVEHASFMKAMRAGGFEGIPLPDE